MAGRKHVFVGKVGTLNDTFEMQRNERIKVLLAKRAVRDLPSKTSKIPFDIITLKQLPSASDIEFLASAEGDPSKKPSGKRQEPSMTSSEIEKVFKPPSQIRSSQFEVPVMMSTFTKLQMCMGLRERTANSLSQTRKSLDSSLQLGLHADTDNIMNSICW